MKKIKIAQIGIGHDHACAIFQSIQNRKDLFEVVGYAEVPEDGFEDEWNQIHLKGMRELECYTTAKQYTVEEILSMPDLDAVTVETYDLNLIKYAQMAADRGLHVFMDKPGSQACEDFEKMLSTLKSKGKVFSIGYMYRENLTVQRALEAVCEGKLGEIYSVEAHMSGDHPRNKREWLARFQGGMTFFLGCHLVDLLYDFQGIPEEIIPYNTNTGILGVPSEDCGFVVFRYKNGVSFLKSCSNEVGGYERRQLVICGSRGTIELKPLEWWFEGAQGQQTGCRYCIRGEQEAYYEWGKPALTEKSPPQDRYEGMLITFAKKVQSGGMTEKEYEREARVHRMVLASCGIKCDYKGEIYL